jgi:hypothetical protein
MVDKIGIEDDGQDADIGNVCLPAEAGKLGQKIDRLLDTAADVFSAARIERYR